MTVYNTLREVDNNWELILNHKPQCLLVPSAP